MVAIEGVNTIEKSPRALYVENVMSLFGKDADLNTGHWRLWEIKYFEYINKLAEQLYSGHDAGHDLEHIYDVEERTKVIILQLDSELDLPLLYTAVKLHDVGIAVSSKWHHIISAYMVRKDKEIIDAFTPEELLTLSEAIEDHRSTNKTVPRNLYGKILSDADRDTEPTVLVLRYCLVLEQEAFVWKFVTRDRASVRWREIVASGNVTLADVREEAYHRFSSKHGSKGHYTRTWLGLTEQEEALKKMHALGEDRNLFDAHFDKIVHKLKTSEPLK